MVGRQSRRLGFPHSLACASFYSHHGFCEKVDDLFGVTSDRSRCETSRSIASDPKRRSEMFKQNSGL